MEEPLKVLRLTMYSRRIPKCTIFNSSGTADFLLPMTHESLQRDVQLAQHMLQTTNIPQGLIIGGHDHVVMDEIVVDETNDEKSVRILKSGMDCAHANVMDFSF